MALLTLLLAQLCDAKDRKPLKKLFEKTLVMNQIDTLIEQIEKTKVVLAESQENFEKNPNSYSARLLLMSAENYLADLLKQLDSLKGQK